MEKLTIAVSGEGGLDTRFSTPLFEQLLQPVQERFPVDFFKELQQFVQQQPIDDDDFRRFHQLSMELVNREAAQKRDLLWTEALVYVLLHILNEKTARRLFWVDGFQTVSVSEKTVPSLLVCQRLLRLYLQWSSAPPQYPCARPYAFFLLMELVNSAESLYIYLQKAGNDFFPLQEYLSVMRGAADSVLAADNSVTNFARKYTENKSILSSALPFNRANAIKHYSGLLASANGNINISRVTAPDSRQTNALIVGLPRSGKTVMIKTLFHSANKGDVSYDNPLRSLYVNRLPEGNEIDSYLSPGRPQPNVSDAWELEGDLHISGKPYTLLLTDTRGGVIEEPPLLSPDKQLQKLEQALTQTDMLLIALDPLTLLQPTIRLFNGIAARVKYLLQHSKHAMVGIILTKFDEYGVVLDGPRSLINTDSKWRKLMEFQQYTSESTWNSFAEEVLDGFTDNQPLRHTLQPLLQKIKPLFSIFCITHQHLPVNLYIVNAIDAKDAVSFQRTGIPVIFQDFEAYMNCLIEKYPAPVHIEPLPPPTPPLSPVTNVVVKPQLEGKKVLALQLSWDAQPECQYELRRREVLQGKDWAPWDNDFARHISTNSYTDSREIAGGSYQYAVLAVSNTDPSRKSIPAESTVYVVNRYFDWIPLLVIMSLVVLAILAYFIFWGSNNDY